MTKIPEVIEGTQGINNYDDLFEQIKKYKYVVIIGTGNSAFPAEYLTWLFRSGTVFHSIFLSPLEYVLSIPQADHVCILFSQGANHSDTFAVKTKCQERKIPFFLICDEEAIKKDTLAQKLSAEEQTSRVLKTFTFSEKGFLSILGTTSAFVVAFELILYLSNDLPSTIPDFDLGKIQKINNFSDSDLRNLVLLYGPAGYIAAKAFAGYCSESIGPVAITSDMRNFCHGVWRGLKSNNYNYQIIFIEDNQTTPLVEFLEKKLEIDYSCSRIKAQNCHWIFEPVFLFLNMIDLWIQLCDSYAETHNKWSPLFVDMGNFPNYKGIISQFDITSLVGSNCVTIKMFISLFLYKLISNLVPILKILY